MIADANTIALGLLLFPLAMFSRRPIGAQNRGRAAAAGPSGPVVVSYLLADDSTVLTDDSANRLTNG